MFSIEEQLMKNVQKIESIQKDEQTKIVKSLKN